MMHKRYTKEQCTAAEAQRLAQEIAFGPVVFQVSRLMLKFGIFQLLSGKREGYTLQEISGQTGLTRYAAQVLLEASLTIGTILLEEDRYVLAKAGWFLLNDKMARVNMEFNHDVNYQGLFHLEEALLNGRPEGLKVFGEWPTIYEGLSQLPEQVQKSWFGFDHFYSDQFHEPDCFRDSINRIVVGDRQSGKSLIKSHLAHFRWSKRTIRSSCMDM